MDRKIFLSSLEIATLRELRRESKNKENTNIKKLKENLENKGFKVNFEVKFGKVQRVSFEKNNVKIDSIKGNERVFTDRVMKSLDENHKKRQEEIAKENSKKPHNRFAEIVKQREVYTKTLGANMYDLKGLSK